MEEKKTNGEMLQEKSYIKTNWKEPKYNNEFYPTLLTIKHYKTKVRSDKKTEFQNISTNLTPRF